jgi:hypothetical protein
VQRLVKVRTRKARTKARRRALGNVVVKSSPRHARVGRRLERGTAMVEAELEKLERGAASS